VLILTVDIVRSDCAVLFEYICVFTIPTRNAWYSSIIAGISRRPQRFAVSHHVVTSSFVASNRLTAPEDLIESKRSQIFIIMADIDKQEPIVIVGAACRLAGEVSSLGTLWDMISRVKTGHGKIPKQRWDANTWHHPDPDRKGGVSDKLNTRLAITVAD
jgi:hypothetical protein